MSLGVGLAHLNKVVMHFPRETVGYLYSESKGSGVIFKISNLRKQLIHSTAEITL